LGKKPEAKSDLERQGKMETGSTQEQEKIGGE
jgi:hypothetical protein